MERQVLLTGIGGQGVQLAAQVLARAALAEGRDVQLFGSYGGMMRGGNTDATLVVADDRVESPPTVGSAWAALVMHHEYAAPTLRRVRDGGVVLVNTTVWEGAIDRANHRVVEVPASDLAVDAGNVIAAGMVMLGRPVHGDPDRLPRCPPWRRPLQRPRLPHAAPRAQRARPRDRRRRARWCRGRGMARRRRCPGCCARDRRTGARCVAPSPTPS